MGLTASVLTLDRHAMQALKVRDAYSLHRVVYSLYDDVRSSAEKQADIQSGILYADQGGDYRVRKILMLANREPAANVDGQYGDVISKPIADHFLAHENYRFKVVVNPTRRDSVSRKLVAVRGREDIGKWFLERASNSWGFVVNPQHLQIDKIEVLRFKDKAERDVTIGQAHVQGVLRVTDRAQFKASFGKGIGRARAFGCGLLQIVPLIENPFA